jgi:hypothetical protein
LKEIENSDELRKKLENDDRTIGIEFKDELKNLNEIPDHLEYKLLFREFGHWETYGFRAQKPKFSNEARPKCRLNEAGCEPPYFDSCFLAIQSAINQNFLKIKTRSDELPTILLQVN